MKRASARDDNEAVVQRCEFVLAGFTRSHPSFSRSSRREPAQTPPNGIMNGLTSAATPSGNQMAKSAYSGVTASVGAESIPAATVAFVPCSIKMNEPVRWFVA
jgi:hypothetical protein